MTTSRLILPEGDLSNKIFIFSDAPREEDITANRPFQGYGGKLLNALLKENNLTREECYLTNILQRRPNYKNTFRSVPIEEITAGIQRLKQEITASGCNVIVPLGNEALQAITSKTGITNWRGSILFTILNGQKYKIIPTFSAPEIFVNWVPNRVFSAWDFKKVKDHCTSSDYTFDPRECIIPSNATSVKKYMQLLLDSPEWLSMDIEINIDTKALICVGFADSPNRAVSFGISPYMFTDGKIGQEASFHAIRTLLQSNIPKITQNGNFDLTWLLTKGYRVNNWYLDTEYMSHLLYVELPKSLGVLTSLYTDQPYHKDMVKGLVPCNVSTWQTMAEYNCLDCMTTYEIAVKLKAQLEEKNLSTFYSLHYSRLVAGPIMEAQLDGVRVNIEKKAQVKAQLQQDALSVVEQLKPYQPEDWLPSTRQKAKDKIKDKIQRMEDDGTKRTGKGVIAKRYTGWVDKLTAFQPAMNFNSEQQVGELLYGPLKEPKRTRRNPKGPIVTTTNNEALTRIIRSGRTKQPIKQFCKLILELRGLNKLISTYLECPLDKDNRIRCEYKVSRTKTGRLSSSRNLFDTGTNLQNIPARKGRGGIIRSLFLPEEGDIFVAIDGKQAEARVVGYAANEPGFITQFEQGKDLFLHIQEQIKQYTERDIERDVCKTIVHATDYGQSLEGFAFEVNMDVEEARPFWYAYAKLFPNLPKWRESVRDQVDQGRVLSNLLGRYRVFYDRVKTVYHNTDNTYGTKWNFAYLRDAFSYIPQSTVGDWLNELLVHTWEKVQTEQWISRKPLFKLQVHDEMIWSLNREDLAHFIDVVRNAARGCLKITDLEYSFNIPLSVSTGDNWGGMEDVS